MVYLTKMADQGGNAHCDSLEGRATSGENGGPTNGSNGCNANNDGSANYSS